MISRAVGMLYNLRAARIATSALVAMIAVTVLGLGPAPRFEGLRRAAGTVEMPAASSLAALPATTEVARVAPVTTGTASPTPVVPPAATPDMTFADAAGASCTVDGVTNVKSPPRHVAASGDALVTVSALNLRAGPSTDCPIVGSLGFGMQVTLSPDVFKGRDTLWRKVTSPVGVGFTVAGTYQGRPAVAPSTVPVLMYHRIADGPDRYYVSPSTFEEQVAWLKEQGYVSITPRDLYLARYSGLALPARPVMFTIDDGNESTLLFAEILEEYGFRGVYFLPNYAQQSPDEIRALDRSGEVCGHTVSHPDLATLDYDGQYAEIVNNKTWLEGIVGHPVNCFAYPFGSYNDLTNQVVSASGYTMAFNAWGGDALLTSDTDPLHILRAGIYGGETWDTFLSIVRSEEGAPS